MRVPDARKVGRRARCDRGHRRVDLRCSPPTKPQAKTHVELGDAGWYDAMVGAVQVKGRRKEEGGREGKESEDRAQIRYLEKDDGKKIGRRTCFSARVGSGILDRRVRSYVALVSLR